MSTRNEYDAFAAGLIEVLKGCLARNMKLPLMLCLLGTNGGVQAFRFHGFGKEMERLVNPVPDGFMELPINIMVVDSSGDAVRVVAGTKGFTFQ
jgi:hypothetical protein